MEAGNNHRQEPRVVDIHIIQNGKESRGNVKIAQDVRAQIPKRGIEQALFYLILDRGILWVNIHSHN